jgi:hypothetical protein
VSRNVVHALIVHYELTEIIVSRNVVQALTIYYELTIVIFLFWSSNFFLSMHFFRAKLKLNCFWSLEFLKNYISVPEIFFTYFFSGWFERQREIKSNMKIKI